MSKWNGLRVPGERPRTNAVAVHDGPRSGRDGVGSHPTHSVLLFVATALGLVRMHRRELSVLLRELLHLGASIFHHFSNGNS